jgi:hypothetical protein
MQESWRNQYKASDLFFCPQRLHKHHENGTSVWHILKYKSCFPQGCISFLWKCRKFDDGHKCHRGKKHVGKDCFSCSFFYDLKNAFQPELLVSHDEYQEFAKEFAAFEEWIVGISGKRIEVRGKITSISPLLTNYGENGLANVSCRGILLYFREGIFKYDRFLDPFYARLSFDVYDRSGVVVGDEIDFKGELLIDRGRFVFEKVGSVEVIRAAGGDQVPANQLRQVKYTGTVIESQPAKCLRCRHGLLIDNAASDGRSTPRRLMYCAKGVADYRYCPHRS